MDPRATSSSEGAGRSGPRGVAEEEEEAPEVKVRLVEWPVKAEPGAEEDVKIRLVEGPGGETGAGPAAAGGGKRRPSGQSLRT